MDYENQQPQTEEGFPWDHDMPSLSPTGPSKKKKPVTTAKVVAIALCFGLVGGALGAAGAHFLWNQPVPEPEPVQPDESQVSHMLEGIRENAVLDTVQVNTGKLQTPAEVYAANVRSTVGITSSITTNFWGYQTTSPASGSGFILTDDGYILTNFHVIDNSSAITVSLYDGTAYDARLIGYDESNDIAVLKVDAEDLSPVILGDSDNMNVGDSVLAIGNPLGELTFSLTAGTVSALDRQVTMYNGITMTLIQTDCAINSGNSGGALFNLYGEVVGITNAKYSSSSSGASIDNIGFAIPMNEVRSIIESIIEKGYISKPFIGVSITDVSAESQGFGLPQGAAVQSVSEGSPAEKAGLRRSDIITQINGKVITGSSDLVRIIGDCKVGDVLTLTVYRQGENLTITLTVGEQIQQALKEQVQQPSTQRENPWGQFGY